jgi:hypothetical protein
MNQDVAPHDRNAGGWRRKVIEYTAYILFWVILSAAGLWLMLQMRGLIVELMIVAQLNPWAVRGYDRAVIFVLGLGWFIAMLWFENYLRTGVRNKRLWRNIFKVASVQAVLAIVILGTRFIIEG